MMGLNSQEIEDKGLNLLLLDDEQIIAK